MFGMIIKTAVSKGKSLEEIQTGRGQQVNNHLLLCDLCCVSILESTGRL